MKILEIGWRISSCYNYVYIFCIMIIKCKFICLKYKFECHFSCYLYILIMYGIITCLKHKVETIVFS
jgi:hypothetical protein